MVVCFWAYHSRLGEKKLSLSVERKKLLPRESENPKKVQNTVLLAKIIK